MHYRASGVFQFAMRLYADHNSMVWLTNAIDSFPGKANREGWMAYVNPNPNLWVEAYISGSYGSHCTILDYGTSSRDTGVLTYVMDFENNVCRVYNSSGTCLRTRADSGMAKLHGKMMAMTIQNYWSSPSGRAWFWDGSPGHEVPYPIDGIPTLYQHLNVVSHGCYEKEENIYGIKKV